jgi:hypothetical protein
MSNQPRCTYLRRDGHPLGFTNDINKALTHCWQPAAIPGCDGEVSRVGSPTFTDHE